MQEPHTDAAESYANRQPPLSPTSVSSRAINKIDRHDENYAFSLQVAVMHSCVVLTHL